MAVFRCWEAGTAVEVVPLLTSGWAGCDGREGVAVFTEVEEEEDVDNDRSAAGFTERRLSGTAGWMRSTPVAVLFSKRVETDSIRPEGVLVFRLTTAGWMRLPAEVEPVRPPVRVPALFCVLTDFPPTACS